MESRGIAESSMSRKPMVSVVLATYNEAHSIESCLVSILSQQTCTPSGSDFDIEVLVVDGMSTDGTRALVDRYAASDARLRVIDNTRRRAPFAFNLGLQNARGEYVCIFGAHSLYRDDYIAVCLSELLAHNAAACGGRVITVPASRSLGARLAAWTMSHPFGSSSKSFRTQSEGPVDTVNYAVFRRDLALAAGGYDEDLLRNQDNDLNQKLRACGFPLWCTWKTQCHYFPKATVNGLIRYGYGNGFWNALSLSKNPAAMGLRHFVPFLFLIALELSAFLGVAAALLTPVPCVARAVALRADPGNLCERERRCSHPGGGARPRAGSALVAPCISGISSGLRVRHAAGFSQPARCGVAADCSPATRLGFRPVIKTQLRTPRVVRFLLRTGELCNQHPHHFFPFMCRLSRKTICARCAT